MLMQWQEMHPYASWTLLYQALIKMNEKDMSQNILKEYLSGLLQVLYHVLYIVQSVHACLCMTGSTTMSCMYIQYIHIFMTGMIY